jgi:hypothetical protein
MLLFLVCSCKSEKKDDLLIVPPNFAELPDSNNPEPLSPKEKEENVAKLKELLLKNDE